MLSILDRNETKKNNIYENKINKTMTNVNVNVAEFEQRERKKI